VLAPFYDRGLHFFKRPGAVSVRLGGREPSLRAKENASVHADQKPEDPRKKQGDRSNVRQEFARLKPEPVSSLGKQTGASPSCLASISRTLAFETYPFGFRPCEGGKRPLSSGACEAPFIQRNVIMPEFRFSVKEFQNIL
jgi:hypothetical protein